MKQILWTKDSVCTATDGICDIDWSAKGISIDSRTTQMGDLFIALKGPRLDGHEFIKQAFANGAVAALVDDYPTELEPHYPVLKVNDTKIALNKLGFAARNRTAAKTIAVTGSVGKTGTKDAIFNGLKTQGKTAASPHSYNNHFGVPLSLAIMHSDADYGVFEVGMNHAGEITPLSKMIRPDVSIITTIEPVHIEFFDTIRDIANAKAEIFTGMDGGIAILNQDNQFYDHLRLLAEQNGVDQILSFGENKGADAQLISQVADCSGTNVEALICDRRFGYRLGIPGKHLVQNSLAVLLAISAVGANVAEAAETLSKINPIDGRGIQHRINIEDGYFTLIDESYNANPASMQAAIETLSTMKPGPCAKRIAVLGDMKELGKKSEDYHLQLSEILVKNAISKVYASGEHMRKMFDVLPSEFQGSFSNSVADLGRQIIKRIRPGDIVTVKGSLSMGMKTIVKQLMELQVDTSVENSSFLNGTA